MIFLKQLNIFIQENKEHPFSYGGYSRTLTIVCAGLKTFHEQKIVISLSRHAVRLPSEYLSLYPIDLGHSRPLSETLLFALNNSHYLDA